MSGSPGNPSPPVAYPPPLGALDRLWWRFWPLPPPGVTFPNPRRNSTPSLRSLKTKAASGEKVGGAFFFDPSIPALSTILPPDRLGRRPSLFGWPPVRIRGEGRAWVSGRHRTGMCMVEAQMAGLRTTGLNLRCRLDQQEEGVTWGACHHPLSPLAAFDFQDL